MLYYALKAFMVLVHGRHFTFLYAKWPKPDKFKGKKSKIVNSTIKM